MPDTPETIACQLLVKLHDPAAQLPTRATSGSAVYDLYSCKDTLIPPGTRKPINTGISIAVPLVPMPELPLDPVYQLKALILVLEL